MTPNRASRAKPDEKDFPNAQRAGLRSSRLIVTFKQ